MIPNRKTKFLHANIITFWQSFQKLLLLLLLLINETKNHTWFAILKVKQFIIIVWLTELTNSLKTSKFIRDFSMFSY